MAGKERNRKSTTYENFQNLVRLLLINPTASEDDQAGVMATGMTVGNLRKTYRNKMTVQDGTGVLNPVFFPHILRRNRQRFWVFVKTTYDKNHSKREVAKKVGNESQYQQWVIRTLRERLADYPGILPGGASVMLGAPFDIIFIVDVTKDRPEQLYDFITKAVRTCEHVSSTTTAWAQTYGAPDRQHNMTKAYPEDVTRFIRLLLDHPTASMERQAAVLWPTPEARKKLSRKVFEQQQSVKAMGITVDDFENLCATLFEAITDESKDEKALTLRAVETVLRRRQEHERDNIPTTEDLYQWLITSLDQAVAKQQKELIKNKDGDGPIGIINPVFYPEKIRKYRQYQRFWIFVKTYYDRDHAEDVVEEQLRDKHQYQRWVIKHLRKHLLDYPDIHYRGASVMLGAPFDIFFVVDVEKKSPERVSDYVTTVVRTCEHVASTTTAWAHPEFDRATHPEVEPHCKGGSASGRAGSA